MKRCNLENFRVVRSCTDAADTSKGRTNTYPKKTARRRRACAALLLCESFFFEQNRAAATPVLCYAVTLNDFLACSKNDEKRAQVIGEAGRDGTSTERERAQRQQTSSSNGITSSQTFPGPCTLWTVLGGWRGVGLGAYPKDICCCGNDGDGGGERRRVCGDA